MLSFFSEHRHSPIPRAALMLIALAWLIVAASFPAARAVAADISGVWTGTTSGPCPNNPTEICDDGYLLTYFFRQRGDELTGTFTGISRYSAARGQTPNPVQLEDGKVQGKKISFAWHTRNIGTKWTSEGIIEGDEITLTDKSEGFTPPAMAHPYTLKKQK